MQLHHAQTLMQVPALVTLQILLLLQYSLAQSQTSTIRKQKEVLGMIQIIIAPSLPSSTGGMGKAATVFFKRSMFSEKKGIPYSKAMGWLRCRLNFALLCCSIMCIRGARLT